MHNIFTHIQLQGAIMFDCTIRVFNCRFAKNSGGDVSSTNKQQFGEQENRNHRAFIRRSSFSDDNVTDVSG